MTHSWESDVTFAFPLTFLNNNNPKPSNKQNKTKKVPHALHLPPEPLGCRGQLLSEPPPRPRLRSRAAGPVECRLLPGSAGILGCGRARAGLPFP